MTNEETNTAATGAQLGAHGAPERAPSKKGASQKKGAPKGQKPTKGKSKASAPKKRAKGGKKPAKARREKTTIPRSESKGAKILEMIARAKGATLAELMRATDWQAHSLRGYLSTAAKKQGIKIESTKNEGGERTYTAKK
jgi:hypothetical protein